MVAPGFGLPKEGLLAAFEAAEGVTTDKHGQVSGWADTTGRHVARPNATVDANRRQRALNAATDPTFLTEEGHGVPPLAFRHQQQPLLHDSRPFLLGGRFPSVLFDGDDYLRLPQPPGFQPRRGGFTVLALIEPLSSAAAAQLFREAQEAKEAVGTVAAAAAEASEAELNEEQKGTQNEKEKKQKKARRRPRQTRRFWLGMGNPGVGDVQWTVSAMGPRGSAESAVADGGAQHLLVARVVPTAFDPKRPSVRNSVGLEGKLTEDRWPAELQARQAAASASGPLAHEELSGGPKALISLILDGGAAAARLNGWEMPASKRYSAQAGLAARDYAKSAEAAGIDFDWEIANDKYGYYHEDNPTDFYLGTGPSAEDHLSYTGDGPAGRLYAAVVYGRELPPAELKAAELHLVCRYGVFRYFLPEGPTDQAEAAWTAGCEGEHKGENKDDL